MRKYGLLPKLLMAGMIFGLTFSAGKNVQAEKNSVETAMEEEDPLYFRANGQYYNDFVDDEVSAFSLSSNSYTHNNKFLGASIVEGIDVSYYQGNIDWTAVKNAGVKYAFVRCGYRGYGSAGTLVTDTKYTQNVQGAINAGISTGVYFLSQAITVEEAQEEADYVLERISGQDLKMPVVFDFEYVTSTGRLATAGLNNQQRTAICNAFCERIENAGYTAMLYAGKSMLNNDLNASEIAAKYPIWMAHYTSKTDYAGDYSYWQYSDSGSISGINNKVDLDFKYEYTPAEVKNITTAATQEGINITWDKVVGVYGYEVYRVNNATQESTYLTTVKGAGICYYTDAAQTDAAQTDAAGYSYAVKAINPSYEGGLTGETVQVTALSAPSNLKVTAADLSSVSLQWEKVTDAEGYYVYRNNGNAYQLIASLSGGDTVSYKDENLAEGTTYEYKVAAYTMVNGTVYTGAESSVCQGTTTKKEVVKESLAGTKTILSGMTAVIDQGEKTATLQKVAKTSVSKTARTITIPTKINGYRVATLNLKKANLKNLKKRAKRLCYIKVTGKKVNITMTTAKAMRAVGLRFSLKNKELTYLKANNRSVYNYLIRYKLA